jgi:hypothetical protein
MKNTWEGVYTNPFYIILLLLLLLLLYYYYYYLSADLKELIPEFYDTYSSNDKNLQTSSLPIFSTKYTSTTYPGDFLVFSSRDLDLSSIPDGDTVGDLVVPVFFLFSFFFVGFYYNYCL